ncbi:DUF6675 family protein [Seohaeicola nanhaiensis]|uniref:DUF6675 family protein n=1 Tax=Seohaeicola nanhaiensis TaxID=1387282 RepID=A0ABV9KJF9_9RHOB
MIRLISLCVVLMSALAAVPALAGPVPPCAGGAVVPGFAGQGQAPRVGVWENETLRLGGGCQAELNGRARLVVALAGRFRHSGGVEDLAARVGAVSKLAGLQYWSGSEGRWRELLSDAYAVTEGKRANRRADFSAAEVLSGRVLLLAQNDTRSSGANVYAMRAVSSSPDALTVTLVNRDSIRLLLVQLFGPGDLVTAQFFQRLGGDEWGFYSLTVVRDGPVEGKQSSFINRAAAYMRLFTGQDPVGAPPVAP